MPTFSAESIAKLGTCHEKLRLIAYHVIDHFDCKVLFGHRGEDEQNKAFAVGASKKRWPESKHNAFPSLAMDLVSFPIEWNNYPRHYFFAGFVIATAYRFNVKLRWGGNWDMDNIIAEKGENDLVHFELVGGIL